MRELNAFVFVTLNGCYKGPNGDISWHRHGEEENQYAAEGLESGSTLLFGRVTYDMMASYWPTPMAMQNDPVVARGMNEAEKLVFSRTMRKASWSNTRVVRGDIVGEVRKLKGRSGKPMTLLGSGSILSLFAEEGLIDELKVMVDPVAVGGGTPILKDIRRTLDLALTGTRTFGSGVVLLSYRPLAASRAGGAGRGIVGRTSPGRER